jgi:Conserved hypothetical protein 95
MRIISGTWRSRPLVAPKGDTTRPTADRTRETLFSMLTSRLGTFEGLQVLDLFAGAGALGLEALSRGAAHCTFVEQDRAALDALEANIAKLGAKPQCDVRRSSVRGSASRPATAKISTSKASPSILPATLARRGLRFSDLNNVKETGGGERSWIQSTFSQNQPLSISPLFYTIRTAANCSRLRSYRTP